MLGTVVGDRYEIVAVLGAGGFGQTYLAIDRCAVPQLDADRCVVKQFRPMRREDEFLGVARRLFQAEAEALKQLGEHPQIPAFLGFFEQSEEFYLVQEWINGHPLNEEISARQLFNEAEAIALLQDVLQILVFVHDRQVLHRDIKPQNLLRRHQDGRMVLIDFGAVKALQTQLLTEAGQTSLTVGIGTQGYTPSEQLLGKPRFCSDLYALGITTIQALTGLHPTKIPVDLETGELQWHDRAKVSLGLRLILDKLVRYHFNQRYQSAEAVLEAIAQLSQSETDLSLLEADSDLTQAPVDTPIDAQFDAPSAPLSTTKLFPDAQPTRSGLSRSAQEITAQEITAQEITAPAIATPNKAKGLRTVILQPARWGIKAAIALAVTTFVTGIQQVGGLQPLELAAFDQMMRLQPDAGPDPRLLVVGITEADLRSLQRSTPSDQQIAEAIAALAKLQPRVIGLDLYRELSQPPGQTELLRQLADQRVITIMQLGNGDQPEIPPPPNQPADRAGFNDLLLDPDRVVRRNLLFAGNSETFYSFSLRVVLQYLSQDQILPRAANEAGWLQLGEAVFQPLTPQAGGYQTVDAAGYQILLDYRARRPARQVSLLEVLQNQVDPAWVKDKIVLIGTTAPSSKDLFDTPYSAGEPIDPQMPGVLLHAQMVSHLLSASLGEVPLFRFLPAGVEVGWMGIWAIAGVVVKANCRSFTAAIGSVLLLGSLAGISLGSFQQRLWLPTATPAIALVASVMVTPSQRSKQHLKK